MLLRSRCSLEASFTRCAMLLAVLLLAAGCASSKPPAAPVRKPAPPVATGADAESRERAYQEALARLRAEREAGFDHRSPAAVAARHKGWSWLVERLARDGIPHEQVARAFADSRVPAFDGLYFSPNPAEPRALYRHFLRAPSVTRAQRCAALHADSLAEAERIHGVDASVVAAILHVETACGHNTGRSIVLHRLARLAMANEPRNLARNLARWSGPTGVLDPALGEKIRARARYLDGIFYAQVLATFVVTEQNGMDPLDLRGSSAGAFGFPQFLPLNYIAFGTDGNGDGRVSLYDPADAVHSAARFLASYGWRDGISRKQKRDVVRHYNRSEPYIDAVLGLADRIAAAGVVASSEPPVETGLEVVPVRATVPRSEPVTRHP